MSANLEYVAGTTFVDEANCGRNSEVVQFRGFDELPPQARSLFSDTSAVSLFSTLGWFEVFVKNALHTEDRLHIYCSASTSHGKSEFNGALATVERSPHTNPFKARRLASLSNYYSPLYTPALGNAPVETVAGEIAKAIASEVPKWDVLDFKPLDVASPVFGAMTKALRSAGYVVQTYFCFGNWYLDVRDRSFEEYFGSLPSKLRNTVNRKSKKLEGSGRSRISITSGGEQLEEAIAAYQKIYSASWKNPEPFPTFVPELIRFCARVGCLRLGTLHVDGEPAAAQLWIVHNRVVSIYKLAYDERFQDLSVGSILSAALFRHALDVDKVREVDYLSGDDEYKKDWMSGRRERWGILAMNPRTPHGAAAILRHVGGRSAKMAIRSFGNRLLSPVRRLRAERSNTTEPPGGTR